MVEEQLWGRDVRDPRVLRAMARVPREQFVPEGYAAHAYEDSPVGIGHNQTISQPYMVARMTELMRVEPGDRVLEIGAGCGYQTAVLMELDAEVYAIEIIDELAAATRSRLSRLGYERFFLECRDGFEGWPEAAPFASIVLAAAPARVPQPLLEQLADGGRLVAPIGGPSEQHLYVYERQGGKIRPQRQFGVRFVPMTGPGAAEAGHAPGRGW